MISSAVSTSPSNRTSARPARARLLVAGLAVAAAGLLVGCSGAGTRAADQPAGATTSTVAPAADPTVTPVADGGGDPAPAATTPVTVTPAEAPSGGDTGSAPSTPPPAPQPTGPAPMITSFTTPENIDCHNGDFQQFSASWTTTGATETMISIDGPGGYRTYGPNDSDSLPFSCSSPHTFLLTAYGSHGRIATRTITLLPRNVQTPDSPDADPADAVPAADA